MASINFGKLTDQQIAFMESVPWHLEQWGEEPAHRRLRTVFPSLSQTGRWFSDEWPVVPWEFVRPSVELGR